MRIAVGGIDRHVGIESQDEGDDFVLAVDIVGGWRGCDLHSTRDDQRYLVDHVVRLRGQAQVDKQGVGAAGCGGD